MRADTGARSYCVLIMSCAPDGKADRGFCHVRGLLPAAVAAGPRPWVDAAVGTQGLGPQCAPSKQFATSTEQELESVALLQARGWGVVVSDYEGYTTGATPTYVAGVSEAHSVLDMARAAASVPGTGISPATRWATMGYSQGGGASSWAASLASAYAPDLQLITDVSGGCRPTSRTSPNHWTVACSERACSCTR
ncbi:lipase family protein [Amycolatopsis sp. NPDC058278]|uniref:lipase family protein n=1 Tax=Amycolatopsis sp. NPDC058278 TaxID=3346417 RepID=UPI0036DAFD52